LLVRVAEALDDARHCGIGERVVVDRGFRAEIDDGLPPADALGKR